MSFSVKHLFALARLREAGWELLRYNCSARKSCKAAAPGPTACFCSVDLPP
ncbi:hypothetical protein [Pyrobaculum aerophilum]|uniref:hypothetical protein n=1 Tax=Pyrobaculum aerophilum TaxID=13773 RepID=UPI000A99FCA5|nr:hypothetical protein [Pyrobaculum aerophilum]